MPSVTLENLVGGIGNVNVLLGNCLGNVGQKTRDDIIIRRKELAEVIELIHTKPVLAGHVEKSRRNQPRLHFSVAQRLVGGEKVIGPRKTKCFARASVWNSNGMAARAKVMTHQNECAFLASGRDCELEQRNTATHSGKRPTLTKNELSLIAKEAIADGYIDYFQGRNIKSDLSGDVMVISKYYDEDAGTSAAVVVERLRGKRE
jgi:hypothetical protein